MKPIFSKKAGTTAHALLLLLFLTTLSCSKDSLKEVVVPEASETPEVPESPNTSGDIVFEANFILNEERTVVNLILSETDYNKFLTGNGDFEMVSKKVYTYLKDDFDFIFILSVEAQQPSGLYYGITSKVKNDIEGIGASIYDNTAAYGSDGKLKSIIHMPRTEYIVSGPFLHEIAHYWGNYGFIPTTIGGHWGYSSAGGQLGGFDELIDLSNNTYHGKVNNRDGFGVNANGGNTLPYSNLELYLMGFIKADELQSIQVAENPQNTQEFGKFTADNIKTYTSAQLITDNGARVPQEQDSQKEFNAITVVISTSKLTNNKVSGINKDLENFSKQAIPDGWGNALNFWQATKEKGSINVIISQESIK